MRIIKIFIVVILLTGFAIGCFALGFMTGKSYFGSTIPSIPDLKNVRQLNRNTDLIREIMVKIQNNYFGKISSEKLVKAAAKGMVSSLNDPYSVYLPPQEHKAFQEMVNGSFFGIGILIGERKGKIEVISPIPGTPAYRIGLQPNDEILKIDKKSTKNLRLNTAVNLIKGPQGTAVVLTVKRGKVKKPLIFKIVRDEIHIPNMVKKMIGKDIGYIAIATFDGTTDTALRGAVKKLVDKGAKGLILDLRNNGGGLLSEAIGVSSVFIGKGTIVSLVERGGKAKMLGARGGAFDRIPLVVLINKGSASASEIVAGAVKDRKRGLVVGEKSFGKGSVQTDFQLSDGGGLKITTAKYRTPSGLSIDKIGIVPNVTVKGGKAVGHGFGGSFVKYKVDPQLQRAGEILRKQMIR